MFRTLQISVNLFVLHELLMVLFITEGIYSSYIIDIIAIYILLYMQKREHVAQCH